MFGKIKSSTMLTLELLTGYQEIVSKSKKIKRRFPDLVREKEQLGKQVERNEEREREKEIKYEEREGRLAEEARRTVGS